MPRFWRGFSFEEHSASFDPVAIGDALLKRGMLGQYRQDSLDMMMPKLPEFAVQNA